MAYCYAPTNPSPGYGSQIVVWNPFTGQTRWIEAGDRCKKPRSFLLGSYYQDKKSRIRSYKILCCNIHGKDTEIYQLNSSDSWRRIPEGDLTPQGSVIFDKRVSLKGNTYFCALEESKPHLGMSLFRFDFSTEKSSLCVRLPYQCPRYEVLSLSAVRDEKLCVFLQPNATSKTEIWVTSKIDDDSTKAVSWSKILAFDLSRDLQITDEVRFVLDEANKVAVCCERWMDGDNIHCNDKIFFLGEDNKVSEISLGLKVTADAGIWPLILNYVSSLVQIERAGDKRKRRD